MSARETETIALPVEAFACLIERAAQALINQMGRPVEKIDAKWLRYQLGVLNELVTKFEILHGKEQG